MPRTRSPAVRHERRHDCSRSAKPVLRCRLTPPAGARSPRRVGRGHECARTSRCSGARPPRRIGRGHECARTSPGPRACLAPPCRSRPRARTLARASGRAHVGARARLGRTLARPTPLRAPRRCAPAAAKPTQGGACARRRSRGRRTHAGHPSGGSKKYGPTQGRYDLVRDAVRGAGATSWNTPFGGRCERVR
jgi:hypothetical protein